MQAEAHDRREVWCRWKCTPRHATTRKVWCGAQAKACDRRVVGCGRRANLGLPPPEGVVVPVADHAEAHDHQEGVVTVQAEAHDCREVWCGA